MVLYILALELFLFCFNSRLSQIGLSLKQHLEYLIGFVCSKYSDDYMLRNVMLSS